MSGGEEEKGLVRRPLSFSPSVALSVCVHLRPLAVFYSPHTHIHTHTHTHTYIHTLAFSISLCAVSLGGVSRHLFSSSPSASSLSPFSVPPFLSLSLSLLLLGAPAHPLSRLPVSAGMAAQALELYSQVRPATPSPSPLFFFAFPLVPLHWPCPACRLSLASPPPGRPRMAAGQGAGVGGRGRRQPGRGHPPAQPHRRKWQGRHGGAWPALPRGDCCERAAVLQPGSLGKRRERGVGKRREEARKKMKKKGKEGERNETASFLHFPLSLPLLASLLSLFHPLLADCWPQPYSRVLAAHSRIWQSRAPAAAFFSVFSVLPK